MRDLMVLLVGVTITAASFSAAAEQTRPAESGHPTVIWNWFDCRMGDRIVPISGRAANGTVTVRETTIYRCNRSDQPAVEVTYTSKPGFTGTDTVHLTFDGGRQQITVNVQ
jgi:hypothetical protein